MKTTETVQTGQIWSDQFVTDYHLKARENINLGWLESRLEGSQRSRRGRVGHICWEGWQRTWAEQQFGLDWSGVTNCNTGYFGMQQQLEGDRGERGES